MKKIGGLDPAHLMALLALLEERHVTRAAERLGLSQSSLSHRLGTLRKQLRDPLLVRAGGSLVLTPRAEAMLPPLAEAVAMLEAAVAPPNAFDPAAQPLHVCLGLPDLLMPTVPLLLAHLRL